MFGHESKPTRLYAYGARAPLDPAPVEEQMLRAHRYRNALVEHELARRKRVEEMLLSLSPTLPVVEADIARVQGEIETARTALKARNAEARKRIALDTDERNRIADLKAQLKALWRTRKDLRTALFGSETWDEAQKVIEEWSTTERKRLRAECGCFWGSYLLVEQAMSGCRSGAPPKFLRFRGDGHLAVQVQYGLSVASLLAGTDQRAKLAVDSPRAESRRARKRLHATLSFRIGTQPDKRSPVFAEIPIVYDRAIPEDAVVKWIHLLRQRIGTHHRWTVQFAVARESWVRTDCAVDGKVGIDVGWRMRPDGSLRVAVWTGSDGREGEVSLSADWLHEMRRVRDIRSVRGNNFNLAKDSLARWIPSVAVPEWIREAARTLHQWKAEARLAALALRWRGSRFEGDGAAFDALEAWRKRDKHLLEFERNLADRLFASRFDLYRKFACKMRRSYRTAVVEALDLRDFHELPAPEENGPEAALREHTRDACLHKFIQCIEESMTEMVKIPAPDTTRVHYDCGSLERWDQAMLMHTCSRCGIEYDQDKNASRVILAGGAASVAVAKAT